MPLLRFLAARRAALEHVQREAGDLLTFLGEMAYEEARTRARAHGAHDWEYAPPHDFSSSPSAARKSRPEAQNRVFQRYRRETDVRRPADGLRVDPGIRFG